MKDKPTTKAKGIIKVLENKKKIVNKISIFVELKTKTKKISHKKFVAENSTMKKFGNLEFLIN